METISACPHHGFDTWMLVNHFYDGMSPSTKQLLETMCGGDFLSKNLDEAMDFLNYVAETSKAWDEPNPREAEKMRPATHQVPTYAKFLKDLCTVKRGFNVNKKAFLTEQVSAIIECKTLIKYKDPGCPTISVNIGGTCVEKALLDLGASVNLLPYSMYKQLGLGELKPTSITLSLADRSIKIPKGTIEDVLIQVDKFYYPVDFVVLDTELVAVGANHVPIILGRPFLATSNAIINCRNGVMRLTFGNMTLELNIFHLSKKHMQPVEDDCEEVCVIDTILEEQANERQVQDVLTQELSECLVEHQDPQCMSLVHGC